LNRLFDYLIHMQHAATDACAFAAGMSKGEFLADKRTQQAIVMSIIIIGEAATKVTDKHSAFVEKHPDVPWRSMRGMRSRIAHGYFDINLDLVWDTVQTALPDLLHRIEHILPDAGDDEA